MKPGDLARIRDCWKQFYRNTKNWVEPGELVLIIDQTYDRIFEVLSSKGMVKFHASYLEVIDGKDEER